MATAICCKSGIELTISHMGMLCFDGGNKVGGVRLHHPVFDLEYSALARPELVARYLDRSLDSTDTILYFLALLHSSNLVTFNHPATPSIATVESNMLPLMDILEWLYTIHHPRLSMPHMAISEDTAELPNIDQWIKAWNQARADFEDGYVALNRAQLMLRKEDTLERVIKSQATDVSKYAGILADWAVLAADVPDTVRDFDGKLVDTAVYWRSLLVTCAKSESHIWRLPIDDLTDMLDWLENHMDAGTIYGHAVLKLVRDGIATHRNYLGFTMLGSTDASSAGILTQNDAEYQYSKILASDAPLTEPRQYDYPNKIAYLQASIKWKQAQKLVSSLDSNISIGGL